MPGGFDFSDVKTTLNQLTSQFASPWSAFPERGQPGLPQQRIDTQFSPGIEQAQLPQMRPEQALSTNRADERTQKSVYDTVAQAQRQSNRTQAAGLYQQAIQWANNARDPALQAVAKVEYGLANMGWGFSEEGFKWLLEAGSNNPSIYDPRSNQSFLKRLSQVGMPTGAVEMLINNGVKDPYWYLKDPNAARKLDQSMSGPAYVAPLDGTPGRQGGDPLAPPAPRPEQALNPNLPMPDAAGPWMREQFTKTMRSALQERDRNTAFGLYKQAIDMADRTGDRPMQATARVELGLAVINWGMPEAGFKWLLDAGAKNPGLYDNRVNQSYTNRLKSAGIPDSAINMLFANGQRDPNWHMRDADAAKKLEAAMRNPNPQVPASPFTPYSRPALPGSDQPSIPAPQPNQPHRKPSPFG